jgi:TRAP-type transport system small permease protein
MSLINRIDRMFVLGLAALCAVLFAIMIASVVGQVVMRYVFSSPLSWSEELARYAMVWQAMLAAALCSRGGQHLALFDTEALPGRIGSVLSHLGTIVICVLLILLLWHSYDLTSRAARQTTPGLGLSMSWIYASLPTGFALMLLGQLLRGFARPSPMREDIVSSPNLTDTAERRH